MTMDFGGTALPTETGFRTALLIGAGVGLAASVVAFLIPVRRASATGEPEQAVEKVAQAA